MAKLHEVLAVEAGLQTTAKQTNEETIKTFGRRDEHFVGTVTEVRHFAEDDKRLDITDAKAMVTTVFDKLLYNVGANVRALDAYIQKEATNQKATADLIVGDVTLAKDVPVTVLLGLETKLVELRLVYEAIPTLAPGPHWLPDTERRATGVYRAERSDITFRTRKTTKPVVLVQPTEHHPAQVDKVVEDVPIARIEKQQWSGMISSAEKSELLARLDRLLRGVKRARQRANSTEVEKRNIGATLFKFIHDGIVA